MKNFFTTFCLGLIPIISSYAQNSARFHHVITQGRINSYGFTLVRRTTAGDQTMEINSTSRGVGRKKIHFYNQRPLFAVVTLDKGLPTLDVWRINPHPTDFNIYTDAIPAVGTAPATSEMGNIDEFGNVISATSPYINAGTPLTGSTFLLLENRATLGDPTRVIRIPFYVWTWSVGTTPFRYRFKTDSTSAALSSNLSASLAFGYTLGKSLFTSRMARHTSNTFSVFAGLSTADINSKTVNEPWKWKKDKTTDRTNGALSYGVSYTRGINNLGLVFSLGFDTAFGFNSSEWSYQNKPWLGLGVNTGLGIFK